MNLHIKQSMNSTDIEIALVSWGGDTIALASENWFALIPQLGAIVTPVPAKRCICCAGHVDHDEYI